MKRGIVAFAIIAFMGMAGPALAADTANLSVTANVVGTCRFNGAPSDLAFGALDPSSGAAASAASQLSFWCTRNAVYTLGDENNPAVADGSFNGNLSDGSGNLIAYTIAYTNTAGNGQGRTVPILSDLTGAIAFAAYQDAAAGNYTDTVTFTINP